MPSTIITVAGSTASKKRLVHSDVFVAYKRRDPGSAARSKAAVVHSHAAMWST